MKEWFCAKELVALPDLPTTARRINTKAQREQWKSQKRPVGKGYEYHVTSLPMSAQAALAARSVDDKKSCSSKIKVTKVKQDTDLLWQRYDKAPQSMKDKAIISLNAINVAITLIHGGSKKTAAFELAAAQYSMHRSSLYRHYNEIKQYPTSDWLPALLPNYKGFVSTKEYSAEAWEFFKADYLRGDQPEIAACYSRLTRVAAENDWHIPSLRTIERWTKSRIPKTSLVLMREGEHALAMLYPALQRTIADMYAGQWVNGDGYQHNVFVEWPDGTVNRPKTWFWQDVYSRKILSFRTDFSENTDTIRNSFGDIVEQYGIPTDVTIDNTRAAANKWLSGGVPTRYRFKVKEDDPIGLFPLLGCKVHWTSVIFGRGHGQAKPIERSFGVGGLGEYVDKHPAFTGAYTGPNTQAKPFNYGDRTIPLKDFLTVLNTEIIAWNAKEKRNTEAGKGIYSFDQAFNASYEKATIKKATAEQRRLWLLQAESIPVKKDGTFTLQAGAAIGGGRNRYFNLDLIPHDRQKIVVRFDPQMLHESVHCYTLDGRYICQAEIFEAAGFGDTVVAREYNKARRNFVSANKEAAKSVTKMDALEIAAQMPSAPMPELPTPGVIQIATATQRVEKPYQQDKLIAEQAQATLIEMEKADSAATVYSLGDDHEKYQLWKKLDHDVKTGNPISDERTARFYRDFTSTSGFEVQKNMEVMRLEFERDLESKQQF